MTGEAGWSCTIFEGFMEVDKSCLAICRKGTMLVFQLQVDPSYICTKGKLIVLLEKKVEEWKHAWTC